MSDSIDEIIQLHAEISKRYKDFELITSSPPPEAVLNELRYVLSSLIKCLQLKKSDSMVDEERQLYSKAVQETLQGLRNAYHDMVDSILMTITRMLDDVSDKYPIATINILGNKQIEILKDINEVNDSIEESRGKGVEREKIYQEDIYSKWFETIANHYKYIDASLPTIIREGERIKQEKLRSKRRFITTVVLTVFGIIVGIVGILLALG